MVRVPPGRISSTQVRARMATARTMAKPCNQRCLKVVTTPATMMRENKKRATNLPKLKSLREKRKIRYPRIKTSKPVRPLSLDQKCRGWSFDRCMRWLFN